MPFPAIQIGWVDIGGKYPGIYPGNARHKSTWARCRSAIMRMSGRGGPLGIPAYEVGVHSIPAPHPYYTHSYTFPSSCNLKLYRTASWPYVKTYENWQSVGGIIGPVVYSYNVQPNNPGPNTPYEFTLSLEGWNVPGLSGYYDFDSNYYPNPEGSPSLLDDSEVQAYWVGALVTFAGLGTVALNYDALDADTDTRQLTGFTTPNHVDPTPEITNVAV